MDAVIDERDSQSTLAMSGKSHCNCKGCCDLVFKPKGIVRHVKHARSLQQNGWQVSSGTRMQYHLIISNILCKSPEQQDSSSLDNTSVSIISFHKYRQTVE